MLTLNTKNYNNEQFKDKENISSRDVSSIEKNSTGASTHIVFFSPLFHLDQS